MGILTFNCNYATEFDIIEVRCLMVFSPIKT